jgi:dTDP-4-amino-4,6-dideoxygalactose transaminase
MCALLLNIQPGDEIIMPSYTFVSTANAFVLRGARIVFADSQTDHPNMDAGQLEPLITTKTKAIVVVHYAGMSVDFGAIKALAERYQLFIVEDAAQAIDSYYQSVPLGSLGHLSAFSFHETKNIISGEGGLLVINDDRFSERADIIWEKGTNRKAFFNGEVAKYGWVDVGSSFLPSEIIAAFLYAQLERLDEIQKKRKHIWRVYYEAFLDLERSGFLKLPKIPSYSTNNGHLFYIVCRSNRERQALISHLKASDIYAVFHYQSLHQSPYYTPLHDGRILPMSDYFSDHLLRLPLFYELTGEEQQEVIGQIKAFYRQESQTFS